MAITKNNTANVSVGKGLEGGYCFIAPTTTSLPDSLEDAFAVASSDEENGWRNMGYIGEDGISSSNSTDTESYADMNGDSVSTGQGTTEKTFTVKFLEIKNDVFQLLYGDDNSTDENGVITTHDKGQNSASYRVLFLLLLKDGRRQARLAGSASISEMGDETVSSTELMGYEVTMSVLKDTSTGDYWTIWTESTETEAAEEGGGSQQAASFQAETIGVAETSELAAERLINTEEPGETMETVTETESEEA